MNGWKQKLSVWIRGNVFIPDARMLWIRPSSRFLFQYVKKYQIQRIISTGPPHSCHMIAYRVKRRIQHIRWIADFRDPWTQLDFYERLRLTSWADKKHHQAEKKVLRTADHVVAVGWYMADAFRKIADRHIDVIPNGFDPDAFGKPHNQEPNGQFILTHIGTLRDDRNDEGLWEGLQMLVHENPMIREKLKIQLIGYTDPSVILSIRSNGLGNHLLHIPHVDHDEVPKYLFQSNVLLLMLNRSPHIEGIITGKIFEYLASGKAILCTGSQSGDAAKIIDLCKAGMAVDFDHPQEIKSILSEWFNQFLEGKSITNPDRNEIESFSRKALTRELIELLN
ncbi:MAG: glycosyltransferase [Saprospiraceae bacterium]|nr:glycosyltransferase [Saprospiraceae bacterium]